MVTLDGVIARNEALHGAWNEYKRMMQYVRARPDELELGAPGGGAPLDERGEPPRRASRLEKFERLLVHLDKTVMASACFRGCIEQDFEEVALAGSETAGDDDADAAPMTVAVRSNATLLEDLDKKHSFDYKARLMGYMLHAQGVLRPLLQDGWQDTFSCLPGSVQALFPKKFDESGKAVELSHEFGRH